MLRPPAAPRTRRHERGLSLVLVGLTMVGLLLFASLAIDFGALYNLRRSDQNAADSAALAAAQDLGRPVAVVAATAKAYVEETLGVDFPDGATGWNSCSADSGALDNAVPNANCITYSAEMVRVRIPDQRYETAFAHIVGHEDFRHSAFAIAGLEREGFGGVLPFGVTGSVADGGYGCLQSNSNGQASAVCGSVSGNFRFLDFGQFGSASLGTAVSCGNGAQDARIRNNIAMGIDHDISVAGTVHPLGSPQIDSVACAADPQVLSPDAVFTRTGNQADDATAGMFSGAAGSFSDGGPARLRRSNPALLGGSAPAPITVSGVTGLDDVPLWRFIPDDYGPGEARLADIPESCKRDQFTVDGTTFSIANVDGTIQTFLAGRTQGDQMLALLQRCIQHYLGQSWTGAPIGSRAPEPPSGCSGTCDSPIFALNSTSADEPDLYDIQYTPRFGYVPELPTFGSGNNAQPIVGFRAVFIQRLFIERGGSGGDITWDPGTVPPPPTSGSFQRLGETSIFVFPRGSLPNNLAEDEGVTAVGANRFPTLIR